MKDTARRRAARARAAEAHGTRADQLLDRVFRDPRFWPRAEWLRDRRKAWADLKRARAAGDIEAALQAAARWIDLEATEPPRPEPGRP